MERHGWRAIIYDAPWARFKSGQIGVIISEDGKSCETTDDNKYSIIVEADENLSLYDRSNGHILFRQKGSDLFDIVCLSQHAGGTYSLEVKDMVIDGCTGKDYDQFINDLIIYEYKNGVKKQITNYNDKKSMCKSPSQNDFIINNYFKNDTESTKTYQIKIEYNGAEAQSTLSSTTAGETYEEYANTTINGADNITICKLEDGSVSCTISKPKNIIDCNGGIVTFSANTKITSDPTYKIDFSSVSASENYNEIKCGSVIGSITKSTDFDIDVTETIGVSNVKKYDDYIEVSVADGKDSIELVISTSKGVQKTKQLTIPLTECTNSAQ